MEHFSPCCAQGHFDANFGAENDRKTRGKRRFRAETIENMMKTTLLSKILRKTLGNLRNIAKNNRKTTPQSRKLRKTQRQLRFGVENFEKHVENYVPGPKTVKNTRKTTLRGRK